MKKENVKKQPEGIKKLKFSMIFSYAFIIVTAIAIVTVLSISKTDEVLKNKVISMSSSLNVQMKLNLDSYISRMETIGTLAFGIEEAYTYDASNPKNDEYEAINTEKIISDKLYSLCIMENFVDYGIVYRNDRYVGKISNGTISLFGNDMFSEMESMITRQRTNDGWATGYKDDFRRIYYVKRIHENALLVISFYSSELNAVFDNPETLSDLEVELINGEHNVIFSEDREKIGQPVASEIYERVAGKSSATIMDDDYLVSVNSCGDGWSVICSIPTKIILNEKNEIKIYILVTAIISAILAILLGAWFSAKITAPVNRIVENLDEKAHIDQLTGIYNKRTFEAYTAQRLSSSLPTEKHALILLDLDNFKGVNDVLGHIYGDEVLAKTGNILRTVFSPGDFTGRIGGDEFCVLLNTSPPQGMEYTEYVKSKCEELCKNFNDNYTGDDGKYKISASIGVSIFPEHGSSFEEMYSASDKALYRSKHKGKDTYTIYENSENSGKNK